MLFGLFWTKVCAWLLRIQQQLAVGLLLSVSNAWPQTGVWRSLARWKSPKASPTGQKSIPPLLRRNLEMPVELGDIVFA
jgi:hypothetical protein